MYIIAIKWPLVYSISTSRNGALQERFYSFLSLLTLSPPSPIYRGNHYHKFYFYNILPFQYNFTTFVLVIHILLFCVFHTLSIYYDFILLPRFLFPWLNTHDNYSYWGIEVSFINFHCNIVFYSIHTYN